MGWDDRVAGLFHDLALDRDQDVVPARVVRVERAACVVATAAGERIARAEVLPAVGDWVALAVGDDDAVVLGAVPRWSQLERGDPDTGASQVLAANVDLVLLTVPGDRPSPARVERESVLAWASGAEPVVVITKADVADAALARALERRLVGTTVVSTSATTGEGVDTLATLLAPGRTAVLLGPSGAGKSTLANALLGADRFATRDVRESDARGRHTTTARQLVAVPSGGVLIDTPGLRSLGLLGDEGIAAAFADIEELALGCRFNDCTHEHEPKCAVVAAVGDGTLAPQRLESYRKLTSEAAGAPRRGRARGGS